MKNAQPRRYPMSIRAVAVIAGFMLLTFVTVLYVRDGYAAIRQTIQSEALKGQVVVEGIGDIALRDVPKANAIRQGHWFDDPHYVGEAHWYPFMTPLMVAIYSGAVGEPLQSAYLIVGMLCSALALFAAGILLYVHFGVNGLMVLPVCILLGIFWPDNGTAPTNTATAPLICFLLIAGSLFETIRTHSTQKVSSLFAALGAMNGLLGLWHGASFFAAGFISFCLIIYYVIKNVRLSAKRITLLVPVLRYGLLLLICISPLIVPQIIHYGTLKQADVARLFLLDIYHGGNAPEALLSFSLVPRGLDGMFLVGFVVFLFIGSAISSRMKLLPYALGYLFCIVFTHLGFVLHSTAYPWLGRISSMLLVSPPHTFYYVSQTLLVIIKMLVIGIVFDAIARTIGKFGNRVFVASAGNYQKSLARIFLIIATSIAYGILMVRFPDQAITYTRTVSQSVFDFTQKVSAMAGPNDAVYVDYEWGQWELMQVYPFKVVYLQSPYHRNPYVEDDRIHAEERLNAVGNDGHTLVSLLQAYHVRYVLTMPGVINAIAVMCSDAPILQSPEGHKLYLLNDTCSEPRLTHQSAIDPVDALALLFESDFSSPLLVGGVKPGTKDHFIAYPKNPVESQQIMEMRIQGHVLGSVQSSCIKPRIAFWKKKKLFATKEFLAHVKGAFDIRFWFVPFDSATDFEPQISFDAECLSAGQKISVSSVTIAQP